MSAAYSSRMRRSSPFFPLADAVAAARNLAAKRESLGWGLWKSYRVRGGDAARVVRGGVRWRRGGGAALVRGGVRYRRGGFPRGRDATGLRTGATGDRTGLSQDRGGGGGNDDRVAL